MPIYEYVCSSCGRRIDVMHGINGQGPSTCEACGGAMKKALSTPAIHFKGSGWAKKDARSAAAPAASSAKKDEPAASGTGGGSDAAAPAAAPAAPAASSTTPSSGSTSTPGA
ncbi:MAG: FmdB family zinc ribbon protein [Chloroflexota bacterium]